MSTESSTMAATPAPPRRAKHTVHWFRKGLRLHDNPALREGLKQASTFRCVFIIDPWFAGSSNVGINKWRFLLECLEDLDSSLRKLNSRLFVVRGQPADALPKLFVEWGTTCLTFEEDLEPFGRVRDNNITAMCRESGITVHSRVSHTLYKLDKIIEKNGGRAPLTYHQFQALIANMLPPAPAEPTINAITLNGATTPISDDHDDRFGLPTLEELGFDIEGLRPAVWIGGESEALARLDRHLERKAWVASFGKPKMTPQSLLASQTGLSPYLRFGCLSTRLFYYQLTELYKRVKRARPPLSLHGQLLWREFFYCAATRNPNFDKMAGNPICVQIPWEKNQKALAKWANGQTGFPWIDAIMIQLREEGWIHHLARHAVACFLTRGDLWISWEEGIKVFDELLLDADWSVNAGMWMWLSCSSFFQQFFHCYCPVRFGRKADPNGDYIRKYVPVLKNMPTKYIHEPWMAPEALQRAARCEVGKDYPMPMVDHSKASKVNIERIKQVYQQLAKYKPQGNEDSSKDSSQLGVISEQNVQRPIMVASPLPTTVITNVNQSSYLCNSPESSQTEQNFENIEHKCTTDNYRNSNLDNNKSSQLQVRSTPYKRVVIVSQQNYNENKDQNNQDDIQTIGNYQSKDDQHSRTYYNTEPEHNGYTNIRDIIMSYRTETHPNLKTKTEEYTPELKQSDVRRKYQQFRSRSETRDYYDHEPSHNAFPRQMSYDVLNTNSNYACQNINMPLQNFTEVTLENYKRLLHCPQPNQHNQSYGEVTKQRPMDCNEHIHTNEYSENTNEYVKSNNIHATQGCNQPDDVVS